MIQQVTCGPLKEEKRQLFFFNVTCQSDKYEIEEKVDTFVECYLKEDFVKNDRQETKTEVEVYFVLASTHNSCQYA